MTALLAAILLLAGVSAATSEARPAAQLPATATAAPETMGVEEVRAGMTGVGYTVVRGTEPEEFGVEILGVLDNIQPKQALIIARLSGLGLERSGVAAGMSGSPVYVDGKLVGAVAYRLGAFATEPIAGITPIDNMLRLAESEATRPEAAAGASAGAGMVAAAADLMRGRTPEMATLQPAVGAAGIAPILTPVSIGGAHPEVVRRLGPLFAAMGWQPTLGGVSQNPRLSGPLKPGSAVAAQLMRGDLSLTATGTVTWVDGERVLAFGHPFMQGGNVDFPMVGAEVLMVINSMADSQKLTAAGTQVIGSIRQDRLAGILGVVGPPPPMIPVRIGIQGAGVEEELSFEMLTDKSLSPTLLFLGLANGLQSVGALLGDSALQVAGELRLDPELGAVRIDNLFSSPGQAYFPLSQTITSIYEQLYDNPFEPIEVRSVDLEITMRSDRRVAEITRVWADRTDVRPGDELTVTVWLKPYRQPETDIEIGLRIPDGLAPGPLTLQVGDAALFSQEQSRPGPELYPPQSIGQLIEKLNKTRPSDRVYYRLSRPDAGAFYGGRPMPSLPPSVLEVLTGGNTSGETVALRNTVLAEGAEQVEYVVSGEHRIELNVRRR